MCVAVTSCTIEDAHLTLIPSFLHKPRTKTRISNVNLRAGKNKECEWKQSEYTS
jgi:hypothetical protein